MMCVDCWLRLVFFYPAAKKDYILLQAGYEGFSLILDNDNRKKSCFFFITLIDEMNRALSNICFCSHVILIYSWVKSTHGKRGKDTPLIHDLTYTRLNAIWFLYILISQAAT